MANTDNFSLDAPSMVTEGQSLTFTLTPQGPFTEALTVRWEIIFEGAV